MTVPVRSFYFLTHTPFLPPFLVSSVPHASTHDDVARAMVYEHEVIQGYIAAQAGGAAAGLSHICVFTIYIIETYIKS